MQPKEVVGYLRNRGFQVSLSTVRAWIVIGRRRPGSGSNDPVKLKSQQIGRHGRRQIREQDLLEFLRLVMGVQELDGVGSGAD